MLWAVALAVGTRKFWLLCFHLLKLKLHSSHYTQKWLLFNAFLINVSSYETENGIKAEETGTLKKASGPDSNDVIVAQGGFSYTAPDGTVINLNYIADDENGFKPEVRDYNVLYKIRK